MPTLQHDDRRRTSAQAHTGSWWLLVAVLAASACGMGAAAVDRPSCGLETSPFPRKSLPNSPYSHTDYLLASPLADLTNDGKLDVAFAYRTLADKSVYYIRANASASMLEPRTLVQAGPNTDTLGASFLALADVDRSGRIDVVVLFNDLYSHSSSRAVVFLADASGVFLWSRNRTLMTNNATTAHGISVTDLNNDSEFDLIFALGTGVASGVYAAMGSAAGSVFATRLLYTLDISGRVTSIYDVDGDGTKELIVVSFFSVVPSLVAYVRGFPNATFASTSTLIVTFTGAVQSVCLGDVSGDLIADAVVMAGDRVPYLVRGLSGGAFSSNPSAIADIGVSAYGQICYLVDLNGDALLDLVTAATGIGVYRGLGDGEFSGMTVVQAQGFFGSYFSQIVFGDLTGDSSVDMLAVISNNVYSVYLFGNERTVGYDASDEKPISPALSSMTIEADFNRDSAIDFAAVFRTEKTLVWFKNDGRGTFTTQVIAKDLGLPYALTPFDVDVSGTIDIVWGSSLGASTIYWCSNPNGDGVWSSPAAFAATTNSVSGFRSLDWDGDSLVDLFVWQPFGSSFVILADASSGAIASSTNVVHVFTNQFYSDVIDVDLDGRPDAVFSGTGNSMVWQRNLGGGVLASNSTMIAPYVGYFAPGDIDGDGDLDFFLQQHSNTPYTFGWMRNIGGGVFNTTTMNPMPAPPELASGNSFFLTACDIDFNGVADVVTSGSLSTSVMVNSGSGVFTMVIVTSSPAGAQNARPIVADLDRDGFLDIAVETGPSFELVWYATRPSFALVRSRTWRWLPYVQVPRVCGGLKLNTRVCIMAALAATGSRCVRASFTLDGLKGCFATPYRLLETLSLAIVGNGKGGGPASVNCPSQGQQALLLVGSSSELSIARVDFVGAAPESGWAPSFRTSLPTQRPLIAVCGGCDASSGARLTLTEVSVTGFASFGQPDADATTRGLGAIAVYAASEFSATDSRFTNNTCGSVGGALALVGTGVVATLDRCAFTGNYATGEPMGVLGGGGGGAIGLMGAGTLLTVNACNFTANAAPSGSGGALLVLPSASSTVVTITNSTIRASSAGVAGGALAINTACSLSLVRSVVTESAAQFGGAIAAVARDVLVTASQLPSQLIALESITPTVLVTLDAASSLGPADAKYGGTTFLCGGKLAFASVSALAGPSFASSAGGYAFTCNVVSAVPESVGSWLEVAGTPVSGPAPNAALAALAHVTSPLKAVDTYGPVVASPPAAFVPGTSATPSTVVSGVAIGSGAVLLVDAFGHTVRDSQLAVRLAIGGLALSTAIADGLLIVLPDAASEYSVQSAVISLRDWPRSLGEQAELVLSLVGTESLGWSPSLSLTAATVLGCPSGWGRVSADSSAIPLVCARCPLGTATANSTTGDATVDLGTTSACVAATVCTGTAVLASDGRCVVCPSGAALQVLANGSDACACTPGRFTPLAMYDVPCEPCPPGASCAGALAAPVALPGFYPDRDLTTGDVVFLACPRAQSCLGAGQCASGYVGRLCGGCARGWYALGGRCFRCRAAQNALVSLVLVLCALAVMAALLAFNLGGYTHRFVAAAIGFQALQLAALFGKLELDWGPLAEVYFTALSLLNVNISLSSPECSLAAGVDAWVVKWALTLALPAFAAGAGAFVALVVLALAHTRLAPALADLTRGEVLNATRRAWFQAMLMMYLPLATTAFALFGCRRDLAGRWVLTDQPSRVCYDTRWWRLFVPALLAVMTYALVAPAALFAYVWRARVRATREHESPELFAVRFGFLVGRFRSRLWGWEAANLSLKLGVILAMTFFFTESARASGAVVVLFASVILLAACQPYRTLALNVFAMTVLGTTCLVLFGGVVTDFVLRRVLVGVGIVATVVVVLVAVGIELWVAARQRAASKRAWLDGADKGETLDPDADARHWTGQRSATHDGPHNDDVALTSFNSGRASDTAATQQTALISDAFSVEALDGSGVTIEPEIAPPPSIAHLRLQ